METLKQKASQYAIDGALVRGETAPQIVSGVVDLVCDHLLNSLPGEEDEMAGTPNQGAIAQGRNQMRQEIITLITNAKK